MSPGSGRDPAHPVQLGHGLDEQLLDLVVVQSLDEGAGIRLVAAFVHSRHFAWGPGR